MALAERSGQPHDQLAAHRVMSFAHFFDGDMRQAMEHSEIARKLLSTVGESASFLATLGFDETFFRGWSGSMLAFAGRLGEAREQIETYREEARRQGTAGSQIFSLTISGYLAGSDGTPDLWVDYARAAVDLAERAGTTYLKIATYASLGEALAAAGRYEEAATALETSLERLRLHRVAVPTEPSVLAALARCRAELGEIDTARQLLEEHRGALSQLDLRFSNASVMDVARALLLCDGPAAADAITEILPTEEKLAAFGQLGQLGDLLECRALLARARGNEAEYRRQLDLGLETYRDMGATGHAARIEQLLAESRRA